MEKDNTENYEILWIRHGESMGNDDPLNYQIGDPNVELTEEGWRQAVRAGQYLRQYLEETAQEDEAMPVFLVGEFMRHRQTFRGIWHGMGMEGEPPKRFDSRLNEQSFGVLPFMIGKDGEFESLSKEYSKKVYKGNTFSASATHGESARFTHSLVKSLMDGTLERDKEEGQKRFVMVTSGRVIQTAVMNWFHLPSDSIANGEMENPNNCDIISIHGHEKNWQAHKIYDGPTAQGCNEDYVADITPLDVPPVPDFILDDPELSPTDEDNAPQIEP